MNFRLHPARNAFRFVDHVRAECDKHGIRYYFGISRRGRNVGYFDDKRRFLFVSVAESDWLTTLAHEFGHLLQWTEGRFGFTPRSEDVDARFEEWLDGKHPRYSARRVLRLVRAIQRCELDAERRAIRLARRWRLTTDFDAVIKSANANVWRYEVARQIRTWPSNTDETMESQLPARLMSVRMIGKPPPLMFPG